VNGGPLITSVEAISTDPLTVTARGYSAGFFCFRGGSLRVFGAEVVSANVSCGNGTFDATVRVAAGRLNTLFFCQRSGVCDAGGCTMVVVDRREPTPTPRADADPCPGDCNRDRRVAVTELVTAVGIALERQPLDDCPALDPGGDGADVGDLVGAVARAVDGCD
jgi:hypothetical protein